MNQGMRLKAGKILKKSLIFIFWIVLWQLVSMAVNKKFIFASPLSTLDALCLLYTSRKALLPLLPQPWPKVSYLYPEAQQEARP